jgi:F-type H+-transporting ATPase subunit gamma
MSNTRELRRRIKSVKNTSQITKAMQMVAATKMRRAQLQALQGRPYAETLQQSIEKLLGSIDVETHPLLTPNPEGKVGVILLSTDKGLCGALNTNLLRATVQFLLTHREAEFLTVGRKGRSFLAKTGKDIEADFENPETVVLSSARQLSKLMVDKFLAQDISEGYIIFPRFVSTLKQEPAVIKLLPIDLSVIADPEGVKQSQGLDNKKAKQSFVNADFIFEPDADALLDFILTHSIETKIYQALLETKASEHSARMIAMQNATDNAQDLVQDLQLTYNQTRQADITNELLEITSASAALE